jgi:hypothetical protein
VCFTSLYANDVRFCHLASICITNWEMTSIRFRVYLTRVVPSFRYWMLSNILMSLYFMSWRITVQELVYYFDVCPKKEEVTRQIDRQTDSQTDDWLRN